MARAKHVPERSCVACGLRGSKRELVRIVRLTENEAEVDPTGKKAGRGSYLCHRPGCWEEGIAKRRLDRALRCNLSPRAREGLMLYARDMLSAPAAGAKV